MENTLPEHAKFFTNTKTGNHRQSPPSSGIVREKSGNRKIGSSWFYFLDESQISEIFGGNSRQMD